jgi:hypothetical protein
VCFKNRHDTRKGNVNKFAVNALTPTVFPVMFANVDCLTNKYSELVLYIAQHEPLLIALCEIYPKCGDKENCAIQIQNYDIILPDRTGNRGVVIYAHNSLSAVKVDLEESTTSFKESVWCKVRLNSNDSLLFGCVYRSPSSSDENNDKLNSLITSACGAGFSHVLMAGDFNYKEILWKEGTVASSENSSPYKFYDCVQDNFLHQHVDQDTRHRGNQRPSLLDLILTNEENMIDSNSIIYDNPLGKSDHSVLIFRYNCYMNMNNNGTPRYQYYKGDYSDMRKDIELVDWDCVLSADNIDNAWQAFSDIITKAMTDHIPRSKGSQTRRVDRPLWMNLEVKEIVAKKRKLWSKYWHTRAYKDFDAYKIIRNKCTAVIRSAKYDYERMIAKEAKTDTKSFWRYIQSKTKTKSRVSDLYRSDGTLSESEMEKANILNEFFCSVFTEEGDLSGIDQLTETSDATTCEHLVIGEESVLKRLEN